MKVLVTGATSLIGAQVVARLVARGDQVTAFQRGVTARPSVPTVDGGIDAARADTRVVDPAQDASAATVVLGDVANAAAVAAAVDGHDAVIHLAAKVGVTGTRDEYTRANVDGTRTVLDAARTAGVTRFVHVSSPSVAHGGDALVGAGVGPADPTATRGHYATTKAEAELIALDASADGFAVTAIRPHLVWGPGDTQLIGRIVDRARQGRLAIVGSGAALIDTTYIDNAADALVAALDRGPHVAGQALVVSNGEPLTVREILERVTAAAGVAPPRLNVPRRVAFAAGLVAERVWQRTGRLDDPPMTSFLAEQLSTAHWFDQRHTRDALAWSPSVSLEEGFERLAQWYAGQAHSTA